MRRLVTQLMLESAILGMNRSAPIVWMLLRCKRHWPFAVGCVVASLLLWSRLFSTTVVVDVASSGYAGVHAALPSSVGGRLVVDDWGLPGTPLNKKCKIVGDLVGLEVALGGKGDRCWRVVGARRTAICFAAEGTTVECATVWRRRFEAARRKKIPSPS